MFQQFCNVRLCVRAPAPFAKEKPLRLMKDLLVGGTLGHVDDDGLPFLPYLRCTVYISSITLVQYDCSRTVVVERFLVWLTNQTSTWWRIPHRPQHP